MILFSRLGAECDISSCTCAIYISTSSLTKAVRNVNAQQSPTQNQQKHLYEHYYLSLDNLSNRPETTPAVVFELPAGGVGGPGGLFKVPAGGRDAYGACGGGPAGDGMTMPDPGPP